MYRSYMEKITFDHYVTMMHRRAEQSKLFDSQSGFIIRYILAIENVL